MKLTDTLFSEVNKLWDKSTEKEFLIKMAKGTLAKESYRYYMLQDYFYLLDYKRIMEKLLGLAEDSEVTGFIKAVIDVVVEETEQVHLPAIKKLGLSEEDIKKEKISPVIAEYIKFYFDEIDKYGLEAGMIALLQCSWNYAYIARKLCDRYGEDIEKSYYKFWFDAYVSEDYVNNNQMWIDIVDKKIDCTSAEKTDNLRRIFKTCAEFENKFWDCVNGD